MIRTGRGTQGLEMPVDAILPAVRPGRTIAEELAAPKLRATRAPAA